MSQEPDARGAGAQGRGAPEPDGRDRRPGDLATGQLIDTQGPGPAYKNLWVPLVVVPFMVVGVLVLVYLFFGMITGKDATPAQNLSRVVSGGANESKQAAASLVAQMVENQRARLRGEPVPWPLDPGFLSQVEAAWVAREDDSDGFLRLALAEVAVECGDPSGFEKLSAILQMGDERDPRAEVRASAMLAMAALGDGRAANVLIPFLEHPDALLRQAAAGILQRFPGPASVQALQRLLTDSSLELRGQAAISLAHLGDDGGASVLVEMLATESYAKARANSPKKYARERTVQDNRVAALQALARLGRSQDRPLLESLGQGDPDLAVREAALRALAQAP